MCIPSVFTVANLRILNLTWSFNIYHIMILILEWLLSSIYWSTRPEVLAIGLSYQLLICRTYLDEGA